MKPPGIPQPEPDENDGAAAAPPFTVCNDGPGSYSETRLSETHPHFFILAGVRRQIAPARSLNISVQHNTVKIATSQFVIVIDGDLLN